jgi:outer membrane biosynthesis protein TonB
MLHEAHAFLKSTETQGGKQQQIKQNLNSSQRNQYGAQQQAEDSNGSRPSSSSEAAAAKAQQQPQEQQQQQQPPQKQQQQQPQPQQQQPQEQQPIGLAVSQETHKSTKIRTSYDMNKLLNLTKQGAIIVQIKTWVQRACWRQEVIVHSNGSVQTKLYKHVRRRRLCTFRIQC